MELHATVTTILWEKVAAKRSTAASNDTSNEIKNLKRVQQLPTGQID